MDRREEAVRHQRPGAAELRHGRLRLLAGRPGRDRRGLGGRGGPVMPSTSSIRRGAAVAGVPTGLPPPLGLAAKVAVRGETVYTMAGPAIKRGVVLVGKDGTIEKVGPASSVS